MYHTQTNHNDTHNTLTTTYNLYDTRKRSATFLGQGKHDLACRDADICVKLRPDWYYMSPYVSVFTKGRARSLSFKQRVCVCVCVCVRARARACRARF
jgi:hypothetical protein